MKRKSIIAVLIMFYIIIGNITGVYSDKVVIIKINGSTVNFPDEKPYIDTVNSRILVPIRFVAESLGAEVGWLQAEQTVTVKREGTNIRLKLGENRGIVNGIVKTLDTRSFSRNGRVFVPLRFVSESLGAAVVWQQSAYTVFLEDKSLIAQNNTAPEFVFQDIAIGDSEQEVLSKLGSPSRKDLSEYGFEWYIYNKDYTNYIQVGIEDNKVVGLYTNADNWKSSRGIEIGTYKEKVESILGKPLDGIIKGNTKYIVSDDIEKSVYYLDKSYVTIFYDIHNNNTVTAVQIIDESTEKSLNGFYGQYSERLRDSFELQIFDLANAIRARQGMPAFIWDEKARISARKHSEDMAQNNFFDHTNLRGQSPFDRMENAGINYRMAAENIAAGTPSAIYAHEGWMNSMGHRKNILGDCKRLGVGAAYGSSSYYKYYYTQNFYTPW